MKGANVDLKTSAGDTASALAAKAGVTLAPQVAASDSERLAEPSEGETPAAIELAVGVSLFSGSPAGCTTGLRGCGWLGARGREARGAESGEARRDRSLLHIYLHSSHSKCILNKRSEISFSIRNLRFQSMHSTFRFLMTSKLANHIRYSS